MKHYDYDSRLQRIRQQPGSTDWLATFLAFVILTLCVAVGLLGLVLPVLPGIVFLVFAALIAARLFPPLDRVLRRNRHFTPYLDQSDNFARLSWRGKIRFVGWMTLKIVVDGFRLAFAGVRRVISYLSKG